MCLSCIQQFTRLILNCFYCYSLVQLIQLLIKHEAFKLAICTHVLKVFNGSFFLQNGFCLDILDFWDKKQENRFFTKSNKFGKKVAKRTKLYNWVVFGLKLTLFRFLKMLMIILQNELICSATFDVLLNLEFVIWCNFL